MRPGLSFLCLALLALSVFILCSAKKIDIPSKDLAEYILKGNWSYESSSWYKPLPRTTWQIQFDGKIDISYNVTAFDLDMFDTSNETIAQLHRQNKKWICYIDVGTWEPDRPDSSEFPPSVLGLPVAGWGGERWLDIRQLDVLAPIMFARFQLAVAKNCDAVDPDNMDGWENYTGFNLTYEDQLVYNKFVSKACHYLGLGVALKNDLAQIPALIDDFDYAINEECHYYNQCEPLREFIKRDKAVLGIEYWQNKETPDKFCPPSNKDNFSFILKGTQLYGIPFYECLDHKYPPAQ